LSSGRKSRWLIVAALAMYIAGSVAAACFHDPREHADHHPISQAISATARQPASTCCCQHGSKAASAAREVPSGEELPSPVDESPCDHRDCAICRYLAQPVIGPVRQPVPISPAAVAYQPATTPQVVYCPVPRPHHCRAPPAA
jgi:hypothetical protein